MNGDRNVAATRLDRASHRWVRHDLDVARLIQRGFLPSLPPTVAGFDVAVAYRPAYLVGGDFYDVIPTGPRRLLAVIGDVSGKGISGALLMSRASSAVRRYARARGSPGELLGRLNALLADELPAGAFVTLACVALDGRRGRVTVANAGHIAPLVRRASGAVVSVGAASGPPVGMFARTSYAEETAPLDAGDVVLLVTDGITDALRSRQDPLGLRALAQLVRRAPSEGAVIRRRIVAAVARHHVAHRRRDDLALLALTLRDGGAAR